MDATSSRAHVLAVVGPAVDRERLFDALSPLSVSFAASVDAVARRAEDDRVDCVVLATDRLADVEAVHGALAVPLVVVVPTDGDLSAAAARDAGAADVVPVVDSNLFERLPERVESVVAWRRRGATAASKITEDLKEQAIDEAPVGITVADCSLPDRPLVYVNEAFEAMTGYSADAALGRNCRYLQGPNTDPERVAELRRAIEAEESASVELLNYRENGETFWNRVDVAPLSGPDGEVTHYVGFQTDITERVRAEAAAERYAERVDEERERLQTLVEHIEGLLADVTSALVRAESRQELEAAVCDRVTAAGSFTCAWVGHCDLAPAVIVPNERAGTDTEFLDGLEIDRSDPDDPTARAAETRTVQSATVGDGSVSGEALVPFDSVIAVPLAHRGTLYGVLTVYTDAAELDDQVRVVFGTLGRAVGAAIDAFESRRSLLSDERLELEIEVRDETQPLVRLAAAGDCELSYRGSAQHDDGTVSLFVSTDPATEFDEADTALDGLRSVDVLPRGDDAELYELTFADGSLVHLVADAGGRLVDLEVDRLGCRLTVVVPDRVAGRALLDDFKSVAANAELRSVTNRSEPPEARREFVASVNDDLTDRQQSALQLAYLGGYFEWPHAVTGDELAETMGVSRATFHQHLHAAERKLISRFFDGEPY
ncbi:PAS domain-containing protein [Haloferax sp. Atlit-4N]|uniref:Receiver/sensor/bat box HTH-10 family transcription regulator n=2 Tax=Haloferax gibbonsii TaxID=35746 RepID=A0A871BCC0_HALGI|nr:MULTISPECIES: bacterio-opsin activator domain-containing protein [Haloferax]ELZ83848.1 bacterio-opsin activator [Haloferax gibbonsii ATCC 33959]QOS10466.1 receiver/sensor/bat box HTH-10 family transcription regulator [Haloferax gibbonsii]RDZ54298.1 PAS domain-containing protein [Haloferax sp. Atlit-4N]